MKRWGKWHRHWPAGTKSSREDTPSESQVTLCAFDIGLEAACKPILDLEQIEALQHVLQVFMLSGFTGDGTLGTQLFLFRCDETMRFKIAIFTGGFAVIAMAIALFWYSRGPASISVSFRRYGTLPAYPTSPCGFFVLSNSGSRTVLVRGVGASSEHQFTQVLSPKGWVDDCCWLSPGAARFYMTPGQTQEVPVVVQTNLPWKIGFHFRETGFVDRCPWFIWRLLPNMAQDVPDFREVWSEPVQALAKP